MSAGQGPAPDRLRTWFSLASSKINLPDGYKLYSGDWGALKSTLADAIDKIDAMRIAFIELDLMAGADQPAKDRYAMNARRIIRDALADKVRHDEAEAERLRNQPPMYRETDIDASYGTRRGGTKSGDPM